MDLKTAIATEQWTSARHALESLVQESVALGTSRQTIQEFATVWLPQIHDEHARMDLLVFALDKLQSRAVSFEEQVRSVSAVWRSVRRASERVNERLITMLLLRPPPHPLPAH